MTISSSLCLLLIAGGCLPVIGGTTPEAATTLYVLHDAAKDQWCAYHDEALWRSAVTQAGALETGTVDFIKGLPKVVKVTEQDLPEAGDWIVYDRYYLNDGGTVMSLQRTTNFAAADVSRKEVFELRGVKLLPKRVTLRSLESGSPITQSSAQFPKLPMATRIATFPFGAVIERSKDVFTHDNLCVPSRGSAEGKAIRR